MRNVKLTQEVGTINIFIITPWEFAEELAGLIAIIMFINYWCISIVESYCTVKSNMEVMNLLFYILLSNLKSKLVCCKFHFCSQKTVVCNLLLACEFEMIVEVRGEKHAVVQVFCILFKGKVSFKVYCCASFIVHCFHNWLVLQVIVFIQIWYFWNWSFDLIIHFLRNNKCKLFQDVGKNDSHTKVKFDFCIKRIILDAH